MQRVTASISTGTAAGVETMRTGMVQHMAGAARTAVERALRQVRQFACEWRGHDTLFHFDSCRVSLVCVKCGYESPGWTVPGAAPAGPARARRQPRDSRSSAPTHRRAA